MKIDPILKQNCKNNKQRKLANIRVRNALNRQYLEMKRNGSIFDFKVIGVKIVNRVQTAAVRIIPHICTDNVSLDIGFIKP